MFLPINTDFYNDWVCQFIGGCGVSQVGTSGTTVVPDINLDYIRNKEGLRLKPYRDGAGWTIGYGHQIKPDEGYLHDGITEQQAEHILNKDAGERLAEVQKRLPHLNKKQRTALVSFLFSMSPNNLKNTKVYKAIKDGKSSEQLREVWMNSFVTVNGELFPPLVARRKDESELFTSQVSGMEGLASVVPLNKPMVLILTVLIILLVITYIKKYIK
jgi:GH24 family phage-related lysozyme (muramidase)